MGVAQGRARGAATHRLGGFPKGRGPSSALSSWELGLGGQVAEPTWAGVSPSQSQSQACPGQHLMPIWLPPGSDGFWMRGPGTCPHTKFRSLAATTPPTAGPPLPVLQGEKPCRGPGVACHRLGEGRVGALGSKARPHPEGRYYHI